MSEQITISWNDLISQIKMSCLVPSISRALVTSQLVKRLADAENIMLEVTELQQAADEFRIAQGLLNVEDTMAWLEKYHLSMDDFEEMISEKVLLAKLANHLFRDKVESFFISHQLEYRQAAIYEVTLEDEDLTMELFYALKEGEIQFHEVAYQYIEDSELRRIGGYRGTLHHNQMKPEVAAAVFRSNPPQIISPITTSQGYHLILVEEISQPELTDELRSKIQFELFSQWLAQKIQQIEVSIIDKSSQQSPPFIERLAVEKA